MVIFSIWYLTNDDLDLHDGEITYNDLVMNVFLSLAFAIPICVVIVVTYVEEKFDFRFRDFRFMDKVAYKRKGKDDV